MEELLNIQDLMLIWYQMLLNLNNNEPKTHNFMK